MLPLDPHLRPRRAFTLLELQVAIILLSFGVVTVASLMAAQARLTKRLERGFAATTPVRPLEPNEQTRTATVDMTPVE